MDLWTVVFLVIGLRVVGAQTKKQFFMIHLKLGNIIIFLYVFNISRLDIVVIDEISLLELIVWVLE